MTDNHHSHQGLQLDDADRARSEQLTVLIREEIHRLGGRLAFDRYMELALYAPTLGYYTAGACQFGEAGDFVTAPEISPLFARCLARQCQQVLVALGGGELLEFGAGTGAMAADLLTELEALDQLPARYLILERSPALRTRQQETLQAKVPQLLPRVSWLDTLPHAGFCGVVLANELLDAMPVHRFRLAAGSVLEQWVRWDASGFQAEWELTQNSELTAAVVALRSHFDLRGEDYYESEINLRAVPWLGALGAFVDAGLVLLIDYGYSRAEYYHPRRYRGTLICHFRHHAHNDPLILPGLQDITAHVDFTAMAEAGLAAGFSIGGYTSQACLLLGCGLEKLLAEADMSDTQAHLTLMQGVKRLTLPDAMGERFKALALTKGTLPPLLGFSLRNFRERL